MTLKLHLVDEDYVNVLVGYPPKPLKLMIDPLAAFSYVFNDTKSTSATTNHETEKFSNVFGSFEGEWRNDFFYLTDDKLINFRMDYVAVTKKESRLDCDGVIGLGYSTNHPRGNIYDLLYHMPDVLKAEKVLSYDKKNKLVTIGEFPYKSNNNPVVYPLYEKKEYPGFFLKLKGFGFITDKDRSKYYERVPLDDDAMLTLMPVIIAPKDRVDYLTTNYLPKLQEKESVLDLVKDDEEFWTDVYITKPKEFLTHTEVLFGKMAYKFKPFDDKGDKKRAKIRYGDVKGHEFKYWYLGIDLINIDRLDLNFEKNTAKIYSSSTYDSTLPRVLLLLEVIIFISIFGLALSCFLRCMCSKPKQKDIKQEELMEYL